MVFIFCFVVTNYTAKILAKCLDGHPGAQTYGDIGYAAFGTRGRMSVSAIFITELVAVWYVKRDGEKKDIVAKSSAYAHI